MYCYLQIAVAYILDGDYRHEAECHIHVNQSLESLSLKNESLIIRIGEQYDLYVQLEPWDADDVVLEWSSSNPSVATVVKSSAFYTKGIISAINTGSTIITAFTKDGKFSASCKVDVPSEWGITGQFNHYPDEDSTQDVLMFDSGDYYVAKNRFLRKYASYDRFAFRHNGSWETSFGGSRVVYEETFTGTQSANSETSNLVTDNSDWIFESAQGGGDGYARINKGTIAKTPMLYFAGSATLTFKTRGSGGTSPINTLTTLGGNLDQTSIIPGSDWTEHTINITNATKPGRISFQLQSNNAFFIDDVKVTIDEIVALFLQQIRNIKL